MGSMSASDAAPLPRLGEVFFDVRGNSRSMRLSWYADTGVAVLSIWQGGICTGTFRLAIGDLPRMVETLQRGPGGRRARWDPAPPGHAFADAQTQAAAQVARQPLLGEAEPDRRAGRADFRTVPGEYPARPPADRTREAGYLADVPGDQPGGAAGYLAGPPGPGAHSGEYLPGPPAPWTGSPEYAASHQAPAPEQRTGYLPDPPDAGRARPRDYGNSIHVGSRTGRWNSGAGASGLDSAGSGFPAAGPESGAGLPVTGPGRLPDDPYLGETGPMDYQREPGAPHYPPGSAVPTGRDATGRTAAEYRADYNTAVTDDTGHEPRAGSFPHVRHLGSHRVASRRTGPDAPFD
jgi:hypothetical protein